MPIFERTVDFPGGGYEGLQGCEWNKQMYFVGGFDGTDYWGITVRSPNGQEIFYENMHNDATSITGRAFHRMIVHENRLYVTGGYDGTSALNDCWVYDGKWTRVATDIGGARYGHVMWSFNGRLYISGGTDGTTIFDDVWTSAEGSHWDRVLDDNNTLSRSFAAGCVYDNKMYLTGGYDGSAAIRDVLTTVDGYNWETQAVPPAFPATCGHTLTSFDNKLVLMSGGTSYTTRAFSGIFNPTQLWYSENGTLWVLGSDDLEFSRVNATAFAFTEQQRLIVSGGFDGTNRYRDIWQTRGVEFLDRDQDWV